jgi:hypothetical protein
MEAGANLKAKAFNLWKPFQLIFIKKTRDEIKENPRIKNSKGVLCSSR